MARLLSAPSQLAYALVGSDLRGAANKPVVIYADAGKVALADILTYDGTNTPGAAIAGSRLTTDGNSLIPQFWYPDSTQSVYYSVNGGPAVKVDAPGSGAVGNVKYVGVWVANTAYAVGDTVTLGGEILWCATAHTSGATFALTNWTHLTKRVCAYNVMLYGAKGDGVTDDSAAIRAAVSAADTAEKASGTYYAEIIFPPATYLLSSATVASPTNKGNAQIPVPLNPTTAKKFTWVFRGVTDSSALPHWEQTTIQSGGATLKSTITQNVDGTFGPPSVIGGPTPAQGYGQATGVFNNVLVVIDGLTIILPPNPKTMGVDNSGNAEGPNIRSLAVNAGVTPGTGLPAQPLNSWAVGVYCSQRRNNDKCYIENLSVEGMFFGLIVSEHTMIANAQIIYCDTGIDILEGADFMWAGYLSIEVCRTMLNFESIGGGGIFCKTRINTLDCEITNAGAFALQNIINDASNLAVGEVNVHVLAEVGTSDQAPTVNGGANLRVINASQRSGNVTAPGVPASTTPLTNPFWRDAAVTITGGTVSAIRVDGVVTGLTSGTVIVPTGRTITLTYTVAPTWVWTTL